MSDADDLEIKKRARRRLVGAAALALLAAVVLPVMMDQEPRPAVQDIQITIPDRDTAPALSRPMAAADEAPSPPPPMPVEEEPRPAATGAAPAEAAKPAAALEQAEVRKAESAPAPKAEAKPDPKAESKPEAMAAAKPAPADARAAAAEDAEAARVRAILGGKDVPARSEAFVLQVGAYSDAAKAAQIAAELKKLGFTAYTEKAGSVTRVRVGPIAGRDAGEKLAARLQAAGHNAVLTPR